MATEACAQKSDFYNTWSENNDTKKEVSEKSIIGQNFLLSDRLYYPFTLKQTKSLFSCKKQPLLLSKIQSVFN